MEKKQSVFETLNAIDVSGHTKKKDGHTYLTWSWAWSEVRKIYPNASFKHREWDGKPYLFDENLGYLVETSVTIEGETISMSLPVMDEKNKAQKAEPYTYTTKWGEKTVNAATMFDINTALMRCLVKNLAMFGLGLYIYAGEDVPEGEESAQPAQPAMANDQFVHYNEAITAINTAKDINELTLAWNKYPDLKQNTNFRNAVAIRRKDITNGN